MVTAFQHANPPHCIPLQGYLNNCKKTVKLNIVTDDGCYHLNDGCLARNADTTHTQQPKGHGLYSIYRTIDIMRRSGRCTRYYNWNKV